jgi:hypothetical protein
MKVSLISIKPYQKYDTAVLSFKAAKICFDRYFSLIICWHIPSVFSRIHLINVFKQERACLLTLNPVSGPGRDLRA